MMKRILLLSIIIIAAVTLHARKINVRGVVTNADGEPLPHATVCIKDGIQKFFRAETNREGKYEVLVDDNATLIFSLTNYNEKEVNVGAQLVLDVELEQNSIQLKGVDVVAKGRKIILPPEADLDVIGDTLVFSHYVPVPRKFTSPSSRVILQPRLTNMTRKEMQYTKPQVFDGKRYHITQDRMYDFNLDRDTLTLMTDVQLRGNAVKGNDVILYRDSIRVDYPKDSYKLNLAISIEDYERILYEKDYIVAEGTKNPLRFLQHNLEPMFVADAEYLPTPDMKPRDTEGDIDLTFRVGQSTLDLDLGNNRQQMDSLLSMIHSLENDPNTMIKGITLYGFASPEGNYNSNRRLAENRLLSARQFIEKNISSSTRQGLKKGFVTGADVEDWSEVEAMLRADSLIHEADQIKEVLARTPNRDTQSSSIQKMPFYSLLQDKYLPRLRRIQFKITSQRYRYLTDDEIANMYRTNPKAMTPYDVWRLYTITDSLQDKEPIARKALQLFPKNIVFASDLTAILGGLGKPTDEYLAPIMEKGGEFPLEAYATLATTYLDKASYTKADSVARMIPDVKKYHRTIMYCKALSGHFREVLSELAQESVFNEVMLLLATKNNQMALERSEYLGEGAKDEYLKAICCQRNGEEYEYDAEQHLRKAIKLDPSLLEIARTDGDLIPTVRAMEYADQQQEEYLNSEEGKAEKAAKAKEAEDAAAAEAQEAAMKALDKSQR